MNKDISGWNRLIVVFVLLFVGAGVILAEEASYSIVFNEEVNNGRYTTNPRNNYVPTALTSGNQEFKGYKMLSEGGDYVASGTFSQVYPAMIAWNLPGFRIGTSKSAGSLALTLSDSGCVNATKVVISAVKPPYWGGTELIFNGKTVPVDADNTAAMMDYTVELDGSELTQIALSVSDANSVIVVDRVTVYYEIPGIEEYTPEMETVAPSEDVEFGQPVYTFMLNNAQTDCQHSLIISRGEIEIGRVAMPEYLFSLSFYNERGEWVADIAEAEAAEQNILAGNTVYQAVVVAERNEKTSQASAQIEFVTPPHFVLDDEGIPADRLELDKSLYFPETMNTVDGTIYYSVTDAATRAEAEETFVVANRGERITLADYKSKKLSLYTLAADEKRSPVVTSVLSGDIVTSVEELPCDTCLKSIDIDSLMGSGAAIELYDMQGRRVDAQSPAPGLYILRHEGKVLKIMIR